MTRQRGIISALVLTGAFALFAVLSSLIQSANSRSWAEVVNGYQMERYLVASHAAAMTAVFAVATVAAVILLSRGLRIAAVLTAVGAAFGPMLLVAAPFTQQMVIETSEAFGPSLGTSTVWYVVVGTALTALIVGAATLVLGRWPGASSDRRWVAAYAGALLGLGLLVAIVPTALSDGTGSTLLPVLVLGYVLLVAGVIVAGAAVARSPRSALVLEATVVLAVWGLYAAYHRDGGAPGVAGWEFGTSPTIATVVTSTLVVVAPLVGVVGAHVAAWVASKRVPAGSTQPQPAI